MNTTMIISVLVVLISEDHVRRLVLLFLHLQVRNPLAPLPTSSFVP